MAASQKQSNDQGRAIFSLNILQCT